MPTAVRRLVFASDRWTCRYCERETLDLHVLRVMALLYSDIWPYVASGARGNWAPGGTFHAIRSHTSVHDHVLALTRWGEETDDNLVTACWRCNDEKGDRTLVELGWGMLPPAATGWDGRTGHLPALLRLADSVTREAEPEATLKD
jgi:5-methylcytosine-specific restriction endonuclease McrA